MYVRMWRTGRVSWFCGSFFEPLMGWERERRKQRETECGNGGEPKKVTVVSFFSDTGMHLSN